MNIHADVKPMLVCKNKAWMISGYDNFLYEIDLDNWEAVFIEKVELKEEYKSPWRGNYAGLMYRNKIICIPDRNNKIAIYDIVTKKFDYIDMPQDNQERWEVTAYALIEDIIYLFSRSQKIIIKVDLRTASCEVYDKIDIDKQISVVAEKDEFKFITQGESLALYSYQVLNKTLQKEFEIENKGKYITFCCDDKQAWFGGMRKKVLCWNYETSTAREIDLSQFDICEYISTPREDCYYKTAEEEFAQPLFLNQFVYGNYVWFVPLRSSHIIRVNRKDYRAEVIELPDEKETFESWSARIGGLFAYKLVFEFVNKDGDLVFYSYKNKVHYIIDADTGKLKETKPAIMTKNMKEEAEDFILRNSAMTENPDCDLNYFMKLITEK